MIIFKGHNSRNCHPPRAIIRNFLWVIISLIINCHMGLTLARTYWLKKNINIDKLDILYFYQSFHNSSTKTVYSSCCFVKFTLQNTVDDMGIQERIRGDSLTFLHLFLDRVSDFVSVFWLAHSHKMFASLSN